MYLNIERVSETHPNPFAKLKKMTLVFDEVKATQAAARLLNLGGGSLNYLALIKLLYKADREALRRGSLPITTDKYVSMKYGPVTSNIYNRIKAGNQPASHPTFWSAHITLIGPHKIAVKNDPGDSELSLMEEKLLDEIYLADGHRDRFDLAEETHRDFPEWKDPGDSSFPIDIADIIEALGLTEEEVNNVKSQIDAQRASFALSA